MVSFEELRELALALPAVTERPSYGTPGFRVGDKFFGRLRPEGDAYVLPMNMDQRELLVATNPEKFYFTAHYKDYPSVLVRFEAVGREEMQDLLAEAWSLVAPKRVLKLHGPTPG